MCQGIHLRLGRLRGGSKGGVRALKWAEQSSQVKVPSKGVESYSGVVGKQSDHSIREAIGGWANGYTNE